MSSTSPIVVLITGANQGIGFSIAQLLSESKKPYTILIGARDISRGNAAVSKLTASKTNEQSTISTIQLDITSTSSISAAVIKVNEDYGRLDILVNNAAIMAGEGGSTTNPEDWRRVFETNVIGTVAITNAFTPLLQKSSNAKIVVVSSSMGSITMAETSPPHPMTNGASPYRASKAAMNMITVEWAKSLKDIKVWSADPGLCATGFAGEYSMSKGRDPREGADIVRQCVEEERDDCLGKVVWEQGGETGVRPW